MSLNSEERVTERLEQFERGYQAALREAAEQIKALPRYGTPRDRVLLQDVLAVVERLRG